MTTFKAAYCHTNHIEVPSIPMMQHLNCHNIDKVQTSRREETYGARTNRKQLKKIGTFNLHRSKVAQVTTVVCSTAFIVRVLLAFCNYICFHINFWTNLGMWRQKSWHALVMRLDELIVIAFVELFCVQGQRDSHHQCTCFSESQPWNRCVRALGSK